MIISIAQEGGGIAGFIPGLQPPDVSVDTEHPPAGTSPENLQALCAKVSEVDLFSLPDPPGPGAAADYITHTIQIQDGNRSRTFRVQDHNEPTILKEVRQLVRKIGAG